MLYILSSKIFPKKPTCSYYDTNDDLLPPPITFISSAFKKQSNDMQCFYKFLLIRSTFAFIEELQFLQTNVTLHECRWGNGLHLHPPHTPTDTDTPTHLYIIWTHTHTHLHPNIHNLTHTPTHTNTHTHSHSHSHTPIPTHAHSLTHICKTPFWC